MKYILIFVALFAESYAVKVVFDANPTKEYFIPVGGNAGYRTFTPEEVFGCPCENVCETLVRFTSAPDEEKARIYFHSSPNDGWDYPIAAVGPVFLPPGYTMSVPIKCLKCIDLHTLGISVEMAKQE